MHVNNITRTIETTTKVKGSKVKISGSEDGKLTLNQKLNAGVPAIPHERL